MHGGIERLEPCRDIFNIDRLSWRAVQCGNDVPQMSDVAGTGLAHGLTEHGYNGGRTKVKHHRNVMGRNCVPHQQAEFKLAYSQPIRIVSARATSPKIPISFRRRHRIALTFAKRLASIREYGRFLQLIKLAIFTLPELTWQQTSLAVLTLANLALGFFPIGA
jgi:hypothetical protein